MMKFRRLMYAHFVMEAVTEYSDDLVRRLIEKITVFDEMLVIEFKSGLEIQVEA